MAEEIKNIDQQLFSDIKELIEETRLKVSQALASNVTSLYWKIGKRIQEEVLQNQRADYGQQIVATLSRQLMNEYGRSFEEKNLRRIIQFAAKFPDYSIVATLWRQLSWSHFKLLIPLKNDLQIEFYTQMCRIENWNVRTLSQKIQSMLFERTAISKKPDDLAKLELKQLTEKDKMSPDLVFRDPYILDFLGLKDTWLEKDLEAAILRKLEEFILELGNGFAFLERQKRMIIDGKDYKLDLLFYHRKLNRLIAIDLKIGKFEAEYKGKMELYLRWLEKYETEANEEKPIGMLLCTEGNKEQIELLQLGESNIKVAEYITEYLPKKLLKEKLHQFVVSSKNIIDNK